MNTPLSKQEEQEGAQIAETKLAKINLGRELCEKEQEEDTQNERDKGGGRDEKWLKSEETVDGEEEE